MYSCGSSKFGTFAYIPVFNYIARLDVEMIVERFKNRSEVYYMKGKKKLL